MKVLAVEDEPVAQLLVESALKSLGHEVIVTGDGEQAWAALADRDLRVVVSDWQLPRLDGLDLCRRIRQQRHDYVCFILLTQHIASEKNIEAAFEAGVDEFLTKPIDVRELRLRLHVAQRILGFTAEVRRLQSFLPICGYCKKVRDDHQYWQDIESYINAHAGTRFTHSICPECYERQVLPELNRMGNEAEPGSEGAGRQRSQ